MDLSDLTRDLEALRDEGAAMGHCVASYANAAALGQCALFSVRCDEGDGSGPQRRLTFEVRLPGSVVAQARGRHNRPATPAERAVLAEWAAAAGLTIPNGVVL